MHLCRRPFGKPRAEFFTLQSEHRLVWLIGCAVDPSAKCIAIRLTELVAQAMSVLDLLNMPACRLEVLLPLPGTHPGSPTITGLSVEVDDPQDVAKPLGELVSDRLPDVAF